MGSRYGWEGSDGYARFLVSGDFLLMQSGKIREAARFSLRPAADPPAGLEGDA